MRHLPHSSMVCSLIINRMFNTGVYSVSVLQHTRSYNPMGLVCPSVVGCEACTAVSGDLLVCGSNQFAQV